MTAINSVTAESAQPLPKFADYGPDAALGLGYSIHVLTDPAAREGEDAESARASVREFNSFWREASSLKDRIYLARVRLIALSHGRGISRRKRTYVQELEKAVSLHAQAEARNFALRFSTAAWALAAKVGGIAIMAGIGYFLARTFAPFIPDWLGERTGEDYPSYAAAFGSVVVGTYLLSLWKAFVRGRGESKRKHQRELADRMYERGKLHEYNVYAKQLVELWEEYTGRTYTKRLTHADMIKYDLDLKELAEVELRDHTPSEIQLALRFLRRFNLQRKTKKKSEPAVEATAEAA